MYSRPAFYVQEAPHTHPPRPCDRAHPHPRTIRCGGPAPDSGGSALTAARPRGTFKFLFSGVYASRAERTTVH